MYFDLHHVLVQKSPGEMFHVSIFAEINGALQTSSVPDVKATILHPQLGHAVVRHPEEVGATPNVNRMFASLALYHNDKNNHPAMKLHFTCGPRHAGNAPAFRESHPVVSFFKRFVMT